MAIGGPCIGSLCQRFLQACRRQDQWAFALRDCGCAKTGKGKAEDEEEKPRKPLHLDLRSLYISTDIALVGQAPVRSIYRLQASARIVLRRFWFDPQAGLQGVPILAGLQRLRAGLQ